MDKEKAAILQGTLDLLVLKTVETMGPLHGWAITKQGRKQLALEAKSWEQMAAFITRVLGSTR